MMTTYTVIRPISSYLNEKYASVRGVAVRDYRNSQWSIPLREYDIFPSRKCDILLSQYDICPKEHIIVIIFSKKIFHRRSLFHTASAVFHQFATQIDFIVGWLYPYDQPTKGEAFSASVLRCTFLKAIFSHSAVGWSSGSPSR